MKPKTALVCGLGLLGAAAIAFTVPGMFLKERQIFPDPQQHHGMNSADEIVVDSQLTFTQATAEKEIPKEILDSLRLVDVEYISFDQRIHRGQLVVHESIADEVKTIFEKMLEQRFPVEKVIPVVVYQWDDEASMADNNTSAFNYRVIYGTNTLSRHALGLAVDINPRLNPYIAKDGTVHPPGAVYEPERPGTLTGASSVVQLFEEYGWEWGGRWSGPKDWQHFEK